MRFPFYCECPGAVPKCTLCQLGELPPEMNKEIPLMATTCQEINDYTSLRLTTECAAEKASYPFDASAYCGCTGFEAPRACTFCPEGEVVRETNHVPEGSGGASCGELMDFADYVRTADLCSSIQAFSSDCCMDSTGPTDAPTKGPPTPAPQAPAPTPAATPAPSVSPSQTVTNPVTTPSPTSSAPERTSILVSIVALIVFTLMG